MLHSTRLPNAPRSWGSAIVHLLPKPSPGLYYFSYSCFSNCAPSFSAALASSVNVCVPSSGSTSIRSKRTVYTRRIQAGRILYTRCIQPMRIHGAFKIYAAYNTRHVFCLSLPYFPERVLNACEMYIIYIINLSPVFPGGSGKGSRARHASPPQQHAPRAPGDYCPRPASLRIIALDNVYATNT